MRSLRRLLVCLLLVACGSERRDPGTIVPGLCGNGVLDPSEVCDGDDLGGGTCEALGFGPGTLSCAFGCREHDVTACGAAPCTPECGARVCGPDPVCGTSCGACTEGSCDAAGACVVVEGMSPPRILDFSSDVTTVRPGGAVVFSAIVTDPDGIDDVIGGQLISDGATYGTFATSASEGAYTISLTWNQMDAVRTIELAPGGAPRVFTAQFFDVAGQRTSRDLAIQLQCHDPALAACGGRCVSLTTDEANCGGCGVTCSARQPPRSEGACEVGVCRYSVFHNSEVSCQQFCASVALTCEPHRFHCRAATDVVAGCFETEDDIGRLETCAEVPPSLATRFDIICQCRG
ncbi:MAG: hypothetical protein RMA76_16895 [Deltaproteobacteria bacterium]|jgi:hypothetical protein